jgi:hypothetical protein
VQLNGIDILSVVCYNAMCGSSAMPIPVSNLPAFAGFPLQQIQLSFEGGFYMPVRPTFGGRKQHSTYYGAVNAIVCQLRETHTLRAISETLNGSGFTTPSGLPFNRLRLANYIRQTMKDSK